MYSKYGKLSTELYEFTKPVGTSIEGDIEYYMERVRHTEGKVLEAGVGTGRVLLPFLEKGFDIDGVDSSAQMLQACRKNCHDRGFRPNLYEMNLEEMELPDQYDVIMMPTGSFCLIDAYDQAVNVLQHFKRHIKKGGRLILDLLLPSSFKEGEVSTEAYRLSVDTGMTLETKSLTIDWVEQRTVQLLTYEKWKNGKLVDTELQHFPLRWYGIQEFTLLLTSVGYTNITCSADYVFGKAPTKADQIITFEAQVGS